MYVDIRVKRSLWATFVSSQRLKHAIHSRHNYWHEHAHHNTRHEETQLGDTTWLPSSAIKDDEEKEMKQEEIKGVLRVQLHQGSEGKDYTLESLVQSCLFGSVHYVPVVNMEACILYAQQ